MPTMTLEAIQAQLPQVIDKLNAGEEVFITRDDKIVARLVGERKPTRRPRKPGTLKGTVLYVAPDFDAPLEEFKDYMP